MDFMNLMKNVQNVQKKVGEVQEELANLDITGESAGGAVKVTCDGQGRFKSIQISAQAIDPEHPASVDLDSLEMLEDIISSAIKDAEVKASKEMEERMKKATGGLNIPGLNFGR